MKSQLPKPNFSLKPARSQTDITTRKHDQKVKLDNVFSQSTSNLTTTRPTQTMNEKKEKNCNDKDVHTNENKAPLPKPNEKKTHPPIKQPLATTSKVTKRPGITINNVIDSKKLKLKTSTSKVSASRPGRTILTVKSALNTSIHNVTNNKASAPLNKWDYKGRFIRVNNELVNLRGLHKDVNTKYKELEELVNSLKSSETAYKSKAEENERLITTTSKELEVTKTELEITKVELGKICEEKEDLTKRLGKSEEAVQNMSKELKVYREKCNVQETTLMQRERELQNAKEQLENMQSLLHQIDRDRRVLHNTIQEMKGNIRVFCRIRPRTPKEVGKPLCSIKYLDESTIEIGKSDNLERVDCSGAKVRGARQEFSFDKVFPDTASQADIFEELSLLVQSALEGYNVCVFAYGQTGSGKTYTMEGEPGADTEGMIPRTVRHIFHEMKQFQLLGWEYRIEASFLEIYNEHIVDLLDYQSKVHEIRMADSRGHDLYVSNLKIEEIHNADELNKCLLTAQRNRAVAATNSNERSSRSHSVARIRLIGVHPTKQEMSIGNLNLVDLAGSERLRNEEAARTTETKNINKSLANLGNVILALLKKQEHVPYRNSKLTHLLMPSLGGNSKTLMLLNISPLDECYNETLNSLRFGSNVNSCRLNNVKRVRTTLKNPSTVVQLSAVSSVTPFTP